MKTATMTEHYTLTQVEDLAKQAFTAHNLVGWDFIFDNAKRRLGICNHSRRVISMSKNYIAILPKAKVEDTLLHEMAHALVGKGHGHDSVWRNKALEIGADGERLYKGDIKVEGKYSATCPNCGKVHPKHKRTHRSGTTACAACCNEFNGGRYTDKYLLVWSQNY